MSVPPAFLSQVFIRKLFAFAGNSLLVYDYLLTLSLEVTHIWNEPWTGVKSLFLINRYGNLIGQTFIMLEETGYLSHGSRRFCLAFRLFAALFAVFSGESIRTFVLMRACAIVRWKRKIVNVVNTLYILYAIGLFAVSVYILLLYDNSSNFAYLDEVGICIVPPATSSLWTIWFMPLFLDGAMFAFVCYSLYRSTRGMPPSQLIFLLGRDALFFYFATLFNVLFSMACWTIYSQDPRKFLPALITYPLLSVIGQRLILNLRRYRTRLDSTRDLSREVNRQIAAIEDVDSDQMEMEEELNGKFQLGNV